MDDTLELNEEQLDAIELILTDELIALGVRAVLLIDLAGNIIADLDDGKTTMDVYSLAALAAGNFGAVSAMAEIIGEKDFSILFHKGEKENIHFTKVNQDLLLITVFEHKISLGFLRLKVAEAVQRIQDLM